MKFGDKPTNKRINNVIIGIDDEFGGYLISCYIFVT